MTVPENKGFSDEDLKRLKEVAEQDRFPMTIKIFPDDLKALLARLEAAEQFIFDPEKDMDECGWCVAEENDDNTLKHQDDCELNLAYKAWRLKAGK